MDKRVIKCGKNKIVRVPYRKPGERREMDDVNDLAYTAHFNELEQFGDNRAVTFSRSRPEWNLSRD